MNKYICLVLCALFAVNSFAGDGEKSVWQRKKHFNIGYVTQSLSPEYGASMKSEFGFSIARGRSIYLHKNPIAGLLKIALDIDYGDVNYAKYKNFKEKYNYVVTEGSKVKDIGMHQIDVGIGVGPTIVVNPVNNLSISAFAHFVPTYSMLLNSDDLSGNYVSFMKYGGEVSWKFIGLGIDYRSGRATYKSSLPGEMSTGVKMNYRTSSCRAYLVFRY